MAEIKDILLSVQAHLGVAVPEIAHLDKDWGQLYYEQPPVKWPCVLLDIEDVRYSQLGHGAQSADSRITVTVAGMRLAKSSGAAPMKERAYELIDLLERIHDALQLFHPAQASPMFRSNLRKILSDSGKEAYQMTYETAYAVAPPSDGRPKHQKISGIIIGNEE